MLAEVRKWKKIIDGIEPTASVSTFIKEDANLKSAEDKLRRKLSSKVHIVVQKTGGGKIEIEFYDENDLNRLYEIIMGKEVM